MTDPYPDYKHWRTGQLIMLEQPKIFFKFDKNGLFSASLILDSPINFEIHTLGNKAIIQIGNQYLNFNGYNFVLSNNAAFFLIEKSTGYFKLWLNNVPLTIKGMLYQNKISESLYDYTSNVVASNENQIYFGFL